MTSKTILSTLYIALTFPAFTAQQNALDFYDPNPELVCGYQYQKPKITGNIDNFADENVLILHRGINFVTEQFTKDQRLAFIANSQVGRPMFCSAAYELANLNYDSNNLVRLTEKAKIISNTVNELNNDEIITINGMDFSNYRYAFQHLYSNNCLGFFNQLNNPSGAYKRVFKDLPFTKNPHLSFSDEPKHPFKYAGGIKNFGNNTPLLPKYDLNGIPRHPILGKFFSVILDEAAVEEFQPLNVGEAHMCGELKLSTHYTNNILSEGEISVAGYVPAESVVFEMPFEVPNFYGEYKPYYSVKYGLTKTRYNNFSKFFRDPSKSQEDRITKEKDLINGLIKAERQDNKLIYENCLVPKTIRILNDRLRQINTTICELSLEFTID